jgi:hypothetical protein
VSISNDRGSGALIVALIITLMRMLMRLGRLEVKDLVDLWRSYLELGKETRKLLDKSISPHQGNDFASNYRI